jgi:acyl carrier protein
VPHGARATCSRGEQLWCHCNTPKIFKQRHIAGELLGRMPTYSNELGGLIMTVGSLLSSEQTTPIKEAFATNDVRTLVADHLGVSVGRVTDEAHFTHDLGADWLDRHELMMVVEDQFAGVEITDADVDQIEVVGDLIRHIETVDNERRQQGVAPVTRKLFGPRLARATTKQQEDWEQVALFF